MDHLSLSFNKRFLKELNGIRKFIAKDSEQRAEKFVGRIYDRCLDLKIFPAACRPSKYILKSDTRDLIVDGYVIPYRIIANTIYILGIFKENAWSE
ncbi:type II toxin-antitoxin system RelE/ParE family toxin [Campylobacter majalis]|uniref:type II toxin-antitoxin system RelE/ParE family toxin n=1 Tax=Campylobacter majalis TaxID=2790656 RepID=UPI003D685D62